jgi:hypothetical protein
MTRNRILAVTAILSVLGGLVVLASPGSADPILVAFCDGSVRFVRPTGTGLTDIFLTQGTATSPQIPTFTFAVSELQLTSGPGSTVQISNPASGLAQLILSDPNNPTDMAIFDFSTTSYPWNIPSTAPTIHAQVFLASNTFPNLDFSPSYNWDASFAGVSVNTDNTANVAPGATGSFTLAAVPEPASAALMVAAGASALAGLGLRRLRRRPAR